MLYCIVLYVTVNDMYKYVCVYVCMYAFVYVCVCVCRTVQPDLLVVSDGSSLRLTNMAVSCIQDIIP